MPRIITACLFVALVLFGCGNETIQNPPIEPAFLRESTFLEGDVLVDFKAERVNNFQTAKFTFNGSVRNNGEDLENARFEIVTETMTTLPTGSPEIKVESTQNFEFLPSGGVQQIALSAEIPNLRRVFVTGRFRSGSTP